MRASLILALPSWIEPVSSGRARTPKSMLPASSSGLPSRREVRLTSGTVMASSRERSIDMCAVPSVASTSRPEALRMAASASSPSRSLPRPLVATK